jgi:hypothetical protein
MVALVVPAGHKSEAQDKIVIYMQMGGQEGQPSVLARTTGARAAAEALGIELHEQYSGWDPQVDRAIPRSVPPVRMASPSWGIRAERMGPLVGSWLESS